MHKFDLTEGYGWTLTTNASPNDFKKCRHCGSDVTMDEAFFIGKHRDGTRIPFCKKCVDKQPKPTINRYLGEHRWKDHELFRVFQIKYIKDES